jgi:hypothetical protein
MASIRVNPQTGVIQKQSFGIFGSSWVDVNEGQPIRVDPESGKIQKQSFGIFGSTWNEIDDDKEIRVNPDTGRIEQKSGIFGTWTIDEDDYGDDD